MPVPGPNTYSTVDTWGRFLNAKHGTAGTTMCIFHVLCRFKEITCAYHTSLAGDGWGEMGGPRARFSPLAMSSLYA